MNPGSELAAGVRSGIEHLCIRIVVVQAAVLDSAHWVMVRESEMQLAGFLCAVDAVTRGAGGVGW